jgi:uncharacterized protein (DUF1778 family)
MLETKELRVRVTEDHYALIKTRAQLQGYDTISAYVRDKLLKVPHKTEQRLIEIYNILVRRQS